MRVLSGIQPSGYLHLGNYFSMMNRMIQSQESNDLLCFIADYHAMTSIQDGKLLAKNVQQAAIDFLSCGLNPEKSVFWVQSHRPEVLQFSWILSNFITVSQLELGHSYKDKIAQGVTANASLFTYPVLMAADILMYGSEKVPVGKDQKQHLEFTRDICQRVNAKYGDILTLPEADILDSVATVPGIDGRKMSKSYGNAIYFFEEEKALKKTVMSIVTDSAGVNEKKSFDQPLYHIYSLFLNEEEKMNLRDKFETPGTGYGDIKKELFSVIMSYFGPMRERRARLMSQESEVDEILKHGSDKALLISQQYLADLSKSAGLTLLV